MACRKSHGSMDPAQGCDFEHMQSYVVQLQILSMVNCFLSIAHSRVDIVKEIVCIFNILF